MLVRPVKVLKVEELADYLRIHKSTAYRMARNKALPAFKVGNEYRFNLEEIDEWRMSCSFESHFVDRSTRAQDSGPSGAGRKKPDEV